MLTLRAWTSAWRGWPTSGSASPFGILGKNSPGVTEAWSGNRRKHPEASGHSRLVNHLWEHAAPRTSHGLSSRGEPRIGLAMAKPVLQPGPDHPITVEPLGRRASVTVAGQKIADSDNALLVREASYPPVIYFPRQDARMDLLERSEHSTYCPYKGDASYFSIPAGGSRSIDAVWSYEAPFDAVSGIKGHLAFYPERVDSIV